MKICTKCKIEKEESEFKPSKKSKDGLVCYCISCMKQYQTVYQKQYFIKQKLIEKNLKEKERQRQLRLDPLFLEKEKERSRLYRINKVLDYNFSHYKTSAKRRNHEFNLTFEEFSEIVNNSCHYCGSRYDIHNGIDRKDNTKGYIKDNCLPCCKYCNIAKRDRTYDDFISWILLTSKNITKSLNLSIDDYSI